MDEPIVVTDRETVRRAVADAPAHARVPIEIRLDVPDPFLAYRRARDGPGGFYLETTGGQPGWGQFGIDPVERLQVSPGAVARADGESPSLAALTGLLEAQSLVRAGCDVPYPCGLFGWLSYDLVRELESVPETTIDDRELAQLQFGLFDCVASWEEPRPTDGPTTLRITACPTVGTGGIGGPDGAECYERGLDRAMAFASAVLEGDPSIGPPPVSADRARFTSDCGRSAFADRVRRVKEYVREGDTFQANVSQRLRAPAVVHPVAAYDALRRVNPSPYSALLEFPGVDLVSASPELLLAARGDRLVTEPIAGTRPRGETADADEELETELLTDEKERAEHAMLVDLERNDLGKVSTYGSVEVSEYRRVDRYSEVMHLVSVVEGQLRDDVTVASVRGTGGATAGETSDAQRLSAAIAAVFPGGTITGAPKPRTMEIIDELETTRRGPYTGSIAAIGFDGRATLNIVIRTLVRHGEEYFLRVGAGIVHDSVPEREYEETLDKARALINAVNEALEEGSELEVAS